LICKEIAMPEYLAPGVFVEEVSFRSKSIEGVSTTTTGFIGPVRYGPVTAEPDIVTSLSEFEHSYGDGNKLLFNADAALESHNFMWHAARSFFEEGGKRLYVSRVFRPLSGSYPPPDLSTASPGSAPYADGHGRLQVGSSPAFRIVASHPGAAGNLRLRFGLRLGPNVLGALPDPTLAEEFMPTITNLQVGDVVWITSAQAFATVPTVGSPPSERSVADLPIYVARKNAAGAWRFSAGGLLPSPPPANPAVDLTLERFPARLIARQSGDSIRPLTLSMDVLSDDGAPQPRCLERPAARSSTTGRPVCRIRSLSCSVGTGNRSRQLPHRAGEGQHRRVAATCSKPSTPCPGSTSNSIRPNGTTPGIAVNSMRCARNSSGASADWRSSTAATTACCRAAPSTRDAPTRRRITAPASSSSNRSRTSRSSPRRVRPGTTRRASTTSTRSPTC
jgi:hypothetical protein